MENTWKSHAGKDMVANVMNQYIIVGMIFKKNRVILPNRPIHVPELEVSTRAAAAVAMEAAAELTELAELGRTSDIVSIFEVARFSMEIEATDRVSAYQSGQKYHPIILR